MKRDFFRLLFELVSLLLLDLMGRWHQRKRSGTTAAVAPVGPYIETFTVTDSGGYMHMNWTGQGIDELTGTFYLEWHNDAENVWEEANLLGDMSLGEYNWDLAYANSPGQWRVRIEAPGMPTAFSGPFFVG